MRHTASRILQAQVPREAVHLQNASRAVSGPHPGPAAPGKFEAKRFCSEKRVITRCDVTYCCIFVVLYMKEPSHADPPAPLSRGRPPNIGYGVETDERGPGLPSRSSGPRSRQRPPPAN